MIKIGICDDSEEEIKWIQQVIHNKKCDIDDEIQIHTFMGAERLISFLQKNKDEMDLLLIDIDMEHMNGIEAASIVNKLEPNCQIAYLTNYLHFATDIHDTKFFYYILKTELEHRFLPMVHKFYNLKYLRSKIIEITRGKSEIILVPEKDIVYLERNKRKTNIILTDGKETICTSESFDKVEQKLSPIAFCRCHYSFIIHWSRVAKIERKCIILTDQPNLPIPISRSHKQRVKEAYLLWMKIQ